MSKKTIYGVIAASLLICSAASRSDRGDPDKYVWRGEYAKVDTEMHEAGKRDAAAYMTMAGDVEEASLALGPYETDSLRAAFLAFKRGQWDDFRRFSSGLSENLWLEVFRLYMRGYVEAESGQTGLCRVELERLFSLVETDGAAQDHHLYEKAVDLYLGTFSGDTLPEDPDRFYHAGLELEASSQLLLSKAFAARGDSVAATVLLLQVSGKKFDERACTIFEELLASGEIGFERLSNEQLVKLALKSINCGLEKPYGSLIDHLSSRDLETGELDYIRAIVLEKNKHRRKARNAFREIFRSGAPVNLKKDALQHIASLDYTMKHFRKASENYRLFGLYYPDDPRSELFLDIAARIQVTRNQWEKAIDIWDEIRKRGANTERGMQAVLSEAVLCYKLHDRKRSEDILTGLLRYVSPSIEPGVLYWLSVVSEQKDQSDNWRNILREKYPYSFYTCALEDCGSFSAGKEQMSVKMPGLFEMEEREREEFIQFVSGPSRDLKLSEHPAWDAFNYLVERGLLEEARACGETLISIFEKDPASLGEIYRCSRENGMIGFGLKALHRSYAGGGVRMSPVRLRWPVAFPGLVAESSSKRGVPPLLVLSIIREESAFERYAVSRAGACGLMQLMPSTGDWIEGKLGRNGQNINDLFDPAFNIEAGVWYIRFLLDRNSDSIIGALASYNAGNAKMSSWRRNFDPASDPMVSIEMIGIEETRKYVKRVLDTMAVYTRLYRDLQ